MLGNHTIEKPEEANRQRDNDIEKEDFLIGLATGTADLHAAALLCSTKQGIGHLENGKNLRLAHLLERGKLHIAESVANLGGLQTVADEHRLVTLACPLVLLVVDPQRFIGLLLRKVRVIRREHNARLGAVLEKRLVVHTCRHVTVDGQSTR